MKKYISFILAFLILFQINIVYAVDAPTVVEDSQPIELPTETPIEEVLTEEELEKIREEERRLAFEKAVEENMDLNYGQLSTSYLLGDFKTGEILEEKDIDSLRAIASTSKILTVYVVLDEAKKGNISLDDKVTIDRETALIGGSSYELKEGEIHTVKDLIKAALVVSGNDSVFALSKFISGSETEFVKLMGKKLDELGIVDYELVNSSGLPNYTINKQNMMSTRGLFQLTRNILMEYPEILEITSTPEIVEEHREFKEKNTNPILGVVPEIDGLKTGYTGLAGRCMVATGMKLGDGIENSDMRLIGITMGSESDAKRYVAIKKLMERGFEIYENKIVGDVLKPIETFHYEYLEPNDIMVYPKDTSEVIKLKDEKITSKYEIGDITKGIRAEDPVGKIHYFVNGEEVYSTDLVVLEDVVESSLVRKLQILYRNMFIAANKIFNT